MANTLFEPLTLKRMKQVYLRICIAVAMLCLSGRLHAQLTATITSYMNVLCNGTSSGSATVTASGGTGPYSYQWAPSGGTQATANNLMAGSYTVTVTDAASAQATATVTLTQPLALTLNMVPTSVTCFTSCNGTFAANPSGGTPPYSASWMPQPSPFINLPNACAGSHTVTITDANGCVVTGSGVVTSPPQLTATISSTSATCNLANGSATVTPTGGTAPYTYAWAPAGGTSATVTGLVSGSYTATVTDANGCTVTNSVVVGNIPGPSIGAFSFSPNDTICPGNAVQITSSVSGGSPPYTYMWVPGNLSTAVITITPTTSTTYTLVVTDANGCSSNAVTTVIVNSTLATNLSVTQATCNQSNGSASVTASGGMPPYSYLWSNSATTNAIANVPAGAYSITVTDAAGCADVTTFGISNVGGPSVSVSTVPTGCTNSNTGTATANVTGISPFTYSWNTTPVQTTATATGLATGNYLVTVSDSAGCVTVGSGTVSAVAGNLFLWAYSSAFSNCSQPTGTAMAWAMGGTAPYSYSWSNGDTTAAANGLAGGNYSVTVNDVNGCQAAGTVFIQSSCANVVQGRLYADVNSNCVYDAGDYGLANKTIVVSPGNYIVTTNSNGDYQVNIQQTGTHTFTTGLLGPYTLTCPVSGSFTLNFPGLGDTITGQDFGCQPMVNYQDLQVSLASGVARPGFAQYYVISYSNQGTTTSSDTVFFVHDSILTLISSAPAMTGYNHPNGYWTYSNLLPGETRTVVLWMQVPTIQNGGFIGRTMFSSARIEPLATDVTPPDNGDDEFDIITGAYDPNLKECWAPGMSANGDILPTDTLLSYTIHFQNTGTDTAFTVVVRDTLPAQLDPLTLVPGASSHAYTYDLQGSNGVYVAAFTFNNILLVDSFRNEPASHGFVEFKIKTMPGLQVGTTIENEADNYFDFNPPITTNLTSNTIAIPLGVAETQPTAFGLYPNPATNAVTVAPGKMFAGKNCTVQLTDLDGRVVRSITCAGGRATEVSLTGLDAGVYLCRIISENGEQSTQKLVIY